MHSGYRSACMNDTKICLEEDAVQLLKIIAKVACCTQSSSCVWIGTFVKRGGKGEGKGSANKRGNNKFISQAPPTFSPASNANVLFYLINVGHDGTPILTVYRNIWCLYLL